jgi:hypothetical protein
MNKGGMGSNIAQEDESIEVDLRNARKKISRLTWALARIAATAEGVVDEQYELALNGCKQIAQEALK